MVCSNLCGHVHCVYLQIETEVGNCRPLSTIYSEIYDFACQEAVDGLVRMLQNQYETMLAESFDLGRMATGGHWGSVLCALSHSSSWLYVPPHTTSDRKHLWMIPTQTTRMSTTACISIPATYVYFKLSTFFHPLPLPSHVFPLIIG